MVSTTTCAPDVVLNPTYLASDPAFAWNRDAAGPRFKVIKSLSAVAMFRNRQIAPFQAEKENQLQKVSLALGRLNSGL